MTQPDGKQLADQLAALANGCGGVCVLGVSQRPRETVGIPLHRLDTVVGVLRHACTGLIEPSLNAVVDRLWLPSTTGDDKAVVKIDVMPSLVVHRGPGGYVQRVGGEVCAMSTGRLARLFQHRSQARLIRFDELVVSSATLEALSAPLCDRFRTSLSGDTREESLRELRMAAYDEDGVLRPTVAGLLMAAPDPRQWMPNALIRAVAYAGEREYSPGTGTPNSRELDAADIAGPLDAQVDRACRFVARNMRVTAPSDDVRARRPQLDTTAVFEAVVNAVVHRDYTSHGPPIRLRLFADRLELHSPGALPHGMSFDCLEHLQSSRNQVLTSLLAKCPVPTGLPGLNAARDTLMDRRGGGVHAILENSYALSGREAEYRVTDGDEVILTIYAAKRRN